MTSNGVYKYENIYIEVDEDVLVLNTITASFTTWNETIDTSAVDSGVWSIIAGIISKYSEYEDGL